MLTRREGRCKYHRLDTNPLRAVIERWPLRDQERGWRIYISQVFVDDQEKAHRFYTDILGFQTKDDISLGEDRWLTVVSPDDPTGPQLLLEPDSHTAVRPYKDALVSDGIPATSFAVDDVAAENERLSALGVKFTQEPWTWVLW